MEKHVKIQSVLHLVSSVGYFGKEHVIDELIKALKGRNIRNTVGVIGNPGKTHQPTVEAFLSLGLNVEVFECRGKWDFKTIRRIREFLKRNRITIVHSHDYKSDIFAYAAVIGLPCRRVATVHNWIKNEKKLKLYAWLDKRILRFFDAIVPVSEPLLNELMSAGINASKIQRINNGIDINKYTANISGITVKKSLGIFDNQYVVGTVGRLSEEKGISYLIDAFLCILPVIANIRLLLVGDGPMLDELRRKVADLGIREHILFAGVSSDMPSMLSAMDVFVLPSVVEAMPMALLEAMAAKRPIVATNVGSVPQLVKDGFNGLLVAPRDVNALAQAIIKLLNDKKSASMLAERASQEVCAKYSSEIMADNYEKLYQKV